MATIIDSLLVTLGLDSSKFDAANSKVSKGLKDTGEQADKTGDKIKKSGKDSESAFSGAARGAAGFFVALGGAAALTSFIEKTVESNAALDRLAKNLGSSAETVSSWSQAAEVAGGSAEGLQGTMDMLSKSQTELQLTGNSSLIPYFSALGIAMTGANGKARQSDEIMLDLSDRFSKMDRTQANNMGRMMGIDQGTMNLLLKGRGEVELMTKRQREASAVTKQQAEESSKLRESMVRNKQEFQAFGRELLSMAMPALQKFFDLMLDLGAWMRDNKEFVQAFLAVIAVGLGAIAVATIPINLTAAAVVALAAAIAALYQDYQVWRRGGDSLINWEMWQFGLDKARDGIKKFKDYAHDAFYRIFAAADAAKSAVTGDMAHARWAWNEAKTGAPAETPAAKPPPKPAPSTVNSMSKSAAGTPEQERQAIAYFVSQGWTPAQAAGLVANVKRESALRPDAVGDSGKAYGLGQWHPDRQAAFKAKFGKPIQGSSLAEQLAFMQFELTEGTERRAGAMLRGAGSAAEAGAAVSRFYERPADREGEAAKRAKLAEQLGMLYGAPGAAGAAPGARSGRAVAANVSTQTSIGEIHIHTQATDAAGIARDLGGQLDYLFTAQTNSGVIA